MLMQAGSEFTLADSRVGDHADLPRATTVCVPTGSPETSDEALVKFIAAGDKTAMGLLYARHAARLYRFTFRLTGNSSLAEDLVSDVFLDVWRSARRFEEKCRVSTWLLAIARHKALSAVRRRVDEPLNEDKAASIKDPSDDPETTADKTARSSVIRKCLTQLSPAHREVMDLVYYHDKSVDEVARIVGIPPNTVKTRMFHARSRLAGLLRRAGVDQS